MKEGSLEIASVKLKNYPTMWTLSNNVITRNSVEATSMHISREIFDRVEICDLRLTNSASFTLRVIVKAYLAGIGLRAGSSGSRSAGASLGGGWAGAGVVAGCRSSTVSVAGVAAVLFCFLILEISSSSLVCLAIAVGTFLTCTYTRQKEYIQPVRGGMNIFRRWIFGFVWFSNLFKYSIIFPPSSPPHPFFLPSTWNACEDKLFIGD